MACHSRECPADNRPSRQDIGASELYRLTGDLYVNRERQSDRPIHENTAYQLLLAPFKSMAVL